MMEEVNKTETEERSKDNAEAGKKAERGKCGRLRWRGLGVF